VHAGVDRRVPRRSPCPFSRRAAAFHVVVGCRRHTSAVERALAVVDHLPFALVVTDPAVLR
jgi:hypothetical protein